MPYCTDRKYDEITCLSNYTCHTCPYWSSNIKKTKDEDEKVNKASSKITHKLNKAETCENYSYWCGKLNHISNCETCEFYESKIK